ncbi:LLM class flavin-dependent oxidoreductase [SAR202 cluster bacterium AD-804-J14_MRT_500m]|nr:LLM class flavin-dependent oxidoreductase [SAR202 cluster bacterium AD-804-J14_MRT_500m]
MEFGIFIMPIHAPEKSFQETLEIDLQTVVLADSLGVSEGWIGEHYTIKWEPIPAPDLFIAKAFGMTERIRLGTGVVLLPLHDPIMLAHRMAMLDHLGKGRFYFGVGTGGVPTEFELFGIPEKNRHGRAAEVLDIVLELWKAEGEVNYKGKHFKVRSPQPWPEVGLGLHVKPYTKPHPPVAMACVSPYSKTAEYAGSKGWIPMSSGFLHYSVLPTHWQTYEKGAKSAGWKPDRHKWRVARTVHVAETMEQAKSEARHNGLWRSTSEYSLVQAIATRGNHNSYRPLGVELDEAVSFDWLMDNTWIIGDPDHCVQKIKELHAEIGGFGHLLLVMNDWDPPEIGFRSLEMFMNEVAPRLGKL